MISMQPRGQSLLQVNFGPINIIAGRGDSGRDMPYIGQVRGRTDSPNIYRDSGLWTAHKTYNLENIIQLA